MASDINPTLTPTKSLTNFRFWCQKVLPLVYDDSLSYYEVLGKMVVQLNDVIDDVNADIENVDTLKEAFLALQTYVNEFFDDIDQLASYAERAEAAQTAANASAINASESAANASASSLAAMNARDAANSAKQAAETSANTASTAATNANTKASEAAQSAITAQTAQASASQSATLAAIDRSAAQTAASTATAKASEANTSATNAEKSATNAADSAAEAVAAVDTVVNGLGNITKTIENVPIATTEDALASIAKKLVVDIEPVQSGTGDPSPDNVRSITGWTGANVTRTSKNVLNNSYYGGSSAVINGITFTNNNGTINVSGTSTGNAYYIIAPNQDGERIKLKAGTYTISCLEATADCVVNYSVIGVVSSVLNDSQKYYTFTLNIDGEMYINVQVFSGKTVNTTLHIQLEIGATVTVYEQFQGDTYNITFPSEAGTVYGGTLENNGSDSWTLTVDKILATFDGTESTGTGYSAIYSWESNTLNIQLREYHDDAINGYITGCICNRFKIAENDGEWSNLTTGMRIYHHGGWGYTRFYIKNPSAFSDVDTGIAWLQNNHVTVLIPVITPVTYTLTNEQAVTLLKGTNNIWTDTGNIKKLEYFTNAENYVTVQIDLAKALIAPVLKEMKADTALVANDFRIVGNTLYRITSNIASGGTLTPNTNCVVTTVGAILKSLLSA